MKTRIGASGLLLLAIVGGTAAGTCWAKDRKAQPHALIAGTVFRESGLSLPGAEITLTVVEESGPGRKARPMEARSDARGEFAFRVPPTPARYRLSVKAHGYLPEEKTVSISGEERVDVFFRLRRASKN